MLDDILSRFAEQISGIAVGIPLVHTLPGSPLKVSQRVTPGACPTIMTGSVHCRSVAYTPASAYGCWTLCIVPGSVNPLPGRFHV